MGHYRYHILILPIPIGQANNSIVACPEAVLSLGLASLLEKDGRGRRSYVVDEP